MCLECWRNENAVREKNRVLAKPSSCFAPEAVDSFREAAAEKLKQSAQTKPVRVSQNETAAQEKLLLTGNTNK